MTPLVNAVEHDQSSLMSLGLTSYQLDALTVLALANAPISRTEWARQLSAVAHPVARPVGTRPSLRPADMAPDIQQFKQLELLIVTHPIGGRSCYELPLGTAIACLEQADRRDVLLTLLAAVRGSTAASYDRYFYINPTELGTALRVALVRNNTRAMTTAIAGMRTQRQRSSKSHDDYLSWLLHTLGTAPPMAWLKQLGQYAEDYLAARLKAGNELSVAVSATFLEMAFGTKALVLPALRYLAMTQPGHAPPAAVLKKRDNQLYWELLRQFWLGDYAAVVESGEQILASMNKRRKYRQLTDVEGLFLALSRAVVSHQQPRAWEALAHSIEEARQAKAGFLIAYKALDKFRNFAATHQPVTESHMRYACGGYDMEWLQAPWPIVWVAGLVHVWCGIKMEDSDWLVDDIARIKARAAHFGARLEHELASVQTALTGGEPVSKTLAAAHRPRAPWELALDTLLTIARDSEAPAEPAVENRHLVWQLLLGQNAVEIYPREVEGSRARLGRKVALSRLLGSGAEHISDADRRILARAEQVHDDFGRQVTYRLGPEALLELVDHPHVIRGSGSSVAVTRGEPTVTATTLADQPDGQMALTLRPRRLLKHRVAWEEQSNDHLVVYERTPLIDRIVRALGEQGMVIPREASEQLGKVLGALSRRVRVNASVDIPIAADVTGSDHRVAMLLHWNGTTLRFQLRVAPLGLDGPRLLPGQGVRSVTAAVDGVAKRTERDLALERAALDEALERCPTLCALAGERLDGQTDDLFVALDLLLELEELGDDLVKAWPRGAPLATPERRQTKDLRIRIEERADWLDIDVTLPVDEGQVLAFKELLENRQGRYIRLADSRFLALTEDLARRLDNLEQLGKNTAQGVRVRPIALQALQRLSEGSGEFKLNGAAKKRLGQLEKALSSEPRLPTAFGATLRDYQLVGFGWLARLALAGLGAILADDMGLGKTVQALALLESRAKRGPALVVAPTSVASNWQDEARRFAPGLRPLPFNDGDRGQLIEELGPRDLLICSYGVLVTERERLVNAKFDTVIFDEAHLLKNARTQRARAAVELQAHFRLALTGTPIENHLGELWSLMNVTVPGLLGTEKAFERRFATPIAQGDRSRSRQLRSMLRPFLLRRTKAEILDELPPRTEVTLRIRPTDAERAFYEALRRRATEQLSAGEAAGQAAGRLQILAEITRLRQAAVDPRLVDPTGGPPGAKLDALVEQLTSLIEGGHRALVFSQFLGSLRAISEKLLASGIKHLTLDGSTPPKVRTARIAAFQDGEVDAFIMSLKAGGVGINLTEADYVIHVDPWWNPAVEEQASGRAHRIGQTRPVTVYRFITEGSIEEKILALHQRKRALADDLLEDMDRAQKLDLDELRALLQ